MVASIHLNINYNCNRYFWEFCYLSFRVIETKSTISEFRWGRYFSRIVIIIDKLLNVLSPAEDTEKRVFVEQKKRDDRF